MMNPVFGKNGQRLFKMKHTIYPYKLKGFPGIIFGKTSDESNLWVFDDDLTELKEEALISGTDLVLEWAINTYDIENADDGFSLTFSNDYFPTAQIKGVWTREGVDDWGYSMKGNWYDWWCFNTKELIHPGWLCPALFLYFAAAPKELYIEVKNKGEVK